MGGAKAVCASVTTADDDDVLVPRGDPRRVLTFALAILLCEVVHREVHALEFAAGNREIARLAGAAGEQDRVELAAEIQHRDVVANVDARPEHDPFCRHQVEAPVEYVLLE